MMNIAVPVFIAAVFAAALIKKADITSAFCEGARESLIASFELFPILILLITAIGMFSASGLSDKLTELVTPLAQKAGCPPECTPLMIIRPISGSGSLAVLDRILTDVQPDSFAAHTACIMMGSTETTLYMISVCYSAVKKKPHNEVFISSFAADITGFIMASVFAGMFFR